LSVQKGSAGGCCGWDRIGINENLVGEYCKTTMHLEMVKSRTTLFYVISGFIISINTTKVNENYERK
jgi:hypothetical protein